MSKPFKHYKCHKEVLAFKILAINDTADPGDESDGSRWINGDLDHPNEGVYVDFEWMRKHKPQVGGYFVLYSDDYSSYSPAKAFEEGYTEIPEK